MWFKQLLKLKRLNICKTCGVAFEPRTQSYDIDDFNNYCQEHVMIIISHHLLLQWAKNNIEKVRELKEKIEKEDGETHDLKYQKFYAAAQLAAARQTGLSGLVV